MMCHLSQAFRTFPFFKGIVQVTVPLSKFRSLFPLLFSRNSYFSRSFSSSFALTRFKGIQGWGCTLPAILFHIFPSPEGELWKAVQFKLLARSYAYIYIYIYIYKRKLNVKGLNFASFLVQFQFLFKKSNGSKKKRNRYFFVQFLRSVPNAWSQFAPSSVHKFPCGPAYISVKFFHLNIGQILLLFFFFFFFLNRDIKGIFCKISAMLHGNWDKQATIHKSIEPKKLEWICVRLWESFPILLALLKGRFRSVFDRAIWRVHFKNKFLWHFRVWEKVGAP